MVVNFATSTGINTAIIPPYKLIDIPIQVIPYTTKQQQCPVANNSLDN